MSHFFSPVDEGPRYNTGLFLTAVAQVIRHQGFSKQVTGKDALALVIANRDEGYEFAAQDFETASGAIAWLFSMEILSSFEQGVLTAISESDIPVRKLNLAQYAIKMYLDTKDVDGGEHIGKVKERITLIVTAFSSEVCDSEWGTSYRTKGRTLDDNVVMWYSPAPVEGMVKIVGTVTKHSEFGGVKTTHLNRVKVA